jgi:hypothetical protein
MGVAGEIYEGGGAKPISWKDVGETVEGEIVAIRTKQLPKFGTEVPETWEDGSPKYTPIVTVQTNDGGDDEDDDGKRDIYLRSNAYTAFGKALREAFKGKPDDSDLIGCTFKIQFYKTEKSGKGQPRKLFRARITRKSTSGDVWTDAEEREAPKPAATNGGRPSAMPVGMPSKVEDDIPFRARTRRSHALPHRMSKRSRRAVEVGAL